MNVCEECKYYHDNCDAKFICRLELEKIRADAIDDVLFILYDKGYINLDDEEYIKEQLKEQK